MGQTRLDTRYKEPNLGHAELGLRPCSIHRFLRDRRYVVMTLGALGNSIIPSSLRVYEY